jgi:3-deoxy-D-manno-octulosonic-acid transferase
MQKLIYIFSIQVLRSIFFIASFFSAKAKLFVAGRKNVFKKLNESFRPSNTPLIWVHCASLGEFEQGRPLIESIKERFPTARILLTFFSPSGYEIRKDYALADYVFYLPWDTPQKAKTFVEITKPAIAIFVKYEFWYFYSHYLKKNGTKIISASCILRPKQIFFKSYGGLFKDILKKFDFFFTQNLETKILLQSIGITNSAIAGDTRFDRVMEIIKAGEEIPIAKQFKNNQKIFVIGSCWPEDLDALAPFINENSHSLKFIIAPHEISESFLLEIERCLQPKSIRYSNASGKAEDYSVLIIDNIGMLSRLYRYGEFAFVGGAFGKGLHNILEAACYGIPIFFGNKNYSKYQEANDLIMRGGAFEVSGYSELKEKYELLNGRPHNLQLACEVTRSYVQENLGATKKIVDYCANLLQKK